MFDYYSRHSRIQFQKPLTIVGFWGVRVPEIAVALAQFSGLSVLDIERQVEHDIGMSLHKFRKQRSEQALLEKEYENMVRSLRNYNRPIIIFMRPQAFLYEPIQKIILDKSFCIHIKQSIVPVFSNILTMLERTEIYRDFYIPLPDPKNIHNIAELMRIYDQAYAKAHRCVDIENKHPLEVAQDLFSEFATC